VGAAGEHARHRIQPFDIELGRCGVFPPSGRPRTLWIGLRDGSPGLTSIYDALDDRLRPFGFTPEARY
jgi:2'-5' RNA ligase